MMATFASLLLAALLVAPRPAHAQTDTLSTQAQSSADDTQVAEGRAAYARGLTAADEVRWSDALREFERAYELARVPSALFNVGTTLRALGRHVEARDAILRLLRDHTLNDAMLAEAQGILREEAARVVHAELAGLADLEGLEVRVDGRRVTLGAERPFILALDPGAHVVEATAPAHATARWEGSLADGARTRLELRLMPLAIDEPVPVAPPPASSVAESPWLWVSLAAALVVGAGLGVGLWAQDDAQLDPTPGRVGLRL